MTAGIMLIKGRAQGPLRRIEVGSNGIYRDTFLEYHVFLFRQHLYSCSILLYPEWGEVYLQSNSFHSEWGWRRRCKQYIGTFDEPPSMDTCTARFAVLLELQSLSPLILSGRAERRAESRRACDALLVRKIHEQRNMPEVIQDLVYQCLHNHGGYH